MDEALGLHRGEADARQVAGGGVDDEFIEASGKVRVTSFNPSHPNYAKGRAEGFCFAKRIID